MKQRKITPIRLERYRDLKSRVCNKYTHFLCTQISTIRPIRFQLRVSGSITNTYLIHIKITAMHIINLSLRNRTSLIPLVKENMSILANMTERKCVRLKTSLFKLYPKQRTFKRKINLKSMFNFSTVAHISLFKSWLGIYNLVLLVRIPIQLPPTSTPGGGTKPNFATNTLLSKVRKKKESYLYFCCFCMNFFIFS